MKNKKIYKIYRLLILLVIVLSSILVVQCIEEKETEEAKIKEKYSEKITYKKNITSEEKGKESTDEINELKNKDDIKEEKSGKK